MFTDEDTKLRIRQNRPESLQQALEAVLELRVLSVGKQALCNTSPFSTTRLWEWLRSLTKTRPSGVSPDVLELHAAVYKQDTAIVYQSEYKVMGTEKIHQEKSPEIFSIVETVNMLELWWSWAYQAKLQERIQQEYTPWSRIRDEYTPWSRMRETTKARLDPNWEFEN